MSVIEKVALVKERRIKQNSQEWFDGEIVDDIKNLDKLKILKNQKCTSAKIFIMRQDIK